MKILVPNYTFDASAKTITFTDYVAITLENILLVTNVTDNVIIYNFADQGGTVASNILTLDYDTTSMSDSDDLQIWYDDPNATQSVSATNLDIRDLSQTSDAVAIYGSDDGGTTKRIIKTDAGGAIQVDLEVANVTVNNGSGASAVNIQDGGNSITVDGPLTDSQLRATAVPVSASTLPLPTGASTLAEQQTQTASLSVLDDWDESDRAKVNLIAGQAGVAGGSGTVGATTQRVTLATDVALPTGDNTIGRTKITDGTTVATVRELGANDAMNVAIVDGSGNQITSFGGGTQYTEDDASVANPVGNQLIARRRDTLSSETTADGDVTALNSTAKGELYVKHVDTISAQGDVAHDAVDSGNPQKIGYKAKNYGSLPTAVADADRVNGIADRYGASFIQHGSPYVRAKMVSYTSAQSNVAMISASANESVRVYGMNINLDYDAPNVMTCDIGFGTASVPASDGVLFSSGGMVSGNYPLMFPAPVAGASNEDLRITTSALTTGTVNIVIYYDIISI